MDSMQMPKVQNEASMGGMPGVPGGIGNFPGSNGVTGQGGSFMPMVQQVEVVPEKKKDVAGLVKTIVIIILSLITATFIGLFVWMFIQYNDAKTDLDGKIALAVAEAKDEQHKVDEQQRVEDEKYPFKNFAGPVDYGELTFQYPKTWSVYIEADASKGGDFKAYLNPGQVDPLSSGSVYALRVSILNRGFDDIVESYRGAVENKNSTLSVESITVNGATANRYAGLIPGTQFQGFIVIIKIRDKTAILQTDSVFFEEDFNKLIETVKFNA